MSYQYLELADIVFMREPFSIGVYRILKKPKGIREFNNHILVDASTFDKYYDTSNYTVVLLSIRMEFVQSNFEMPEEVIPTVELDEPIQCTEHEFVPQKMIGGGFVLTKCIKCGYRGMEKVHNHSPKVPNSAIMNEWLSGAIEADIDDIDAATTAYLFNKPDSRERIIEYRISIGLGGFQ